MLRPLQLPSCPVACRADALESEAARPKTASLWLQACDAVPLACCSRAPPFCHRAARALLPLLLLLALLLVLLLLLSSCKMWLLSEVFATPEAQFCCCRLLSLKVQRTLGPHLPVSAPSDWFSNSTICCSRSISTISGATSSRKVVLAIQAALPVDLRGSSEAWVELPATCSSLGAGCKIFQGSWFECKGCKRGPGGLR